MVIGRGRGSGSGYNSNQIKVIITEKDCGGKQFSGQDVPHSWCEYPTDEFMARGEEIYLRLANSVIEPPSILLFIFIINQGVSFTVSLCIKIFGPLVGCLLKRKGTIKSYLLIPVDLMPLVNNHMFNNIQVAKYDLPGEYRHTVFLLVKIIERLEVVDIHSFVRK